MPALNSGRGKRCAHSGKDVLFMLLMVAKHGGKWDFLALMFKAKAPTFERMVILLLELVSEVLYVRFVVRMQEKYSMLCLLEKHTLFRHFPYTRVAIDVSFQHANRPSGTKREAKALL